MGRRPSNTAVKREGRRDASVEDLTLLRDNPNLTGLRMQVDGTIVHGWSSPVRLTSAFSVMWSASYHLTEETSRFILSTGTAGAERLVVLTVESG